MDGVVSISVSRAGVTVEFALPAEWKDFDHYPAGPSVKELEHATYRTLQEKAPQKLDTRAERYFREKDLGDLLFTPPYCPALQPIELFWAHGKNYVAEKYQLGCTLDDARRLLREGWYGPHKADTSRHVATSFPEANRYIERDEVLAGSVDNLENVPVIYKVSKGASAVSKRAMAIMVGAATARTRSRNFTLLPFYFLQYRGLQVFFTSNIMLTALCDVLFRCTAQCKV